MALYNPVVRAQENIARTLDRGLSRIGDRPLQEAQFGLQEAGLMHEMGRQKLSDERAGRSLDLQEQEARHEFPWQQEADAQTAEAHKLGMKTGKFNLENAAKKAQMDQWLFEKKKKGVVFDERMVTRALQEADAQDELASQHLTVKGFTPFILGPRANEETMADFLSQRKMQEMLKLTGAKLVEHEGEQKFLKKNNQFATWHDMPQFLPFIDDVMKTTADPGHYLDQKIREYEQFRSQPGAPMTPEAEEQYAKWKKNQKDPQWLIDQYENQNARSERRAEKYAQMGKSTKLFEDRIARNKIKIAKQEAKKAATAGASLKIYLEKIKSAGKLIGTLEKNARFLQSVNPDMTLANATDIVRADESMAERIRGAYGEIDAINFLDYGADPEGLQEKIDSIKLSWGIDSETIKRGVDAGLKPTEPEAAKPDAGARYMELRAEGKTPQEAAEQLRKEGFKP